jgi:hypothetical protein
MARAAGALSLPRAYNGASVKLLATLCLLPLLLPAEEPRKIDKICAAGDAEFLGVTCSPDDPCPVFLELAAVESSGNALFLTGNLHTVSTTLFGVLLTSQDRGKTWFEPDRRIRAAALEQIQFIDREHGWISGMKLEPLPRNPFLMITSDGGKSWKAAPVFEEMRFGSIVQFWFTSLTEGALIMDASQGKSTRFERYETHNGGTSWESKDAADHELRLEHAAEAQNWRFRIEGDSYRVETRSSGDWETVAQFAVQAGECR